LTGRLKRSRIGPEGPVTPLEAFLRQKPLQPPVFPQTWGRDVLLEGVEGFFCFFFPPLAGRLAVMRQTPCIGPAGIAQPSFAGCLLGLGKP